MGDKTSCMSPDFPVIEYLLHWLLFETGGFCIKIRKEDKPQIKRYTLKVYSRAGGNKKMEHIEKKQFYDRFCMMTMVIVT